MDFRSARPTALRGRRVAAILTAAGLVVVGLATGGASATIDSGSPRAVKVDSTLLSQLTANPAGGVTGHDHHVEPRGPRRGGEAGDHGPALARRCR